MLFQRLFFSMFEHMTFHCFIRALCLLHLYIHQSSHPISTILIQSSICYSDSSQNLEVLQWMKSWPKTTSMYPECISFMINKRLKYRYRLLVETFLSKMSFYEVKTKRICEGAATTLSPFSCVSIIAEQLVVIKATMKSHQHMVGIHAHRHVCEEFR